MALLDSEKYDLLGTLTIELESMFTVLSNLNAPDSDSAKYLSEVETEIKAALKERQLLVADLSR